MEEREVEEREVEGEEIARDKNQDEGEEKGGERASSAAAPARRRAPKRKSPEELLSALQPPECKFGLSYADHCFIICAWRDNHKEMLMTKKSPHPSRQRAIGTG